MVYPAPVSFLNVSDDFFKRRYFVGFKSNPYYDTGFTWNIRNDTTDIEYKIIKKTRSRPIHDILMTDEITGEIIGTTGVTGGDTVTLNDWLAENLDGIYNYIYDHYFSEIQGKTGADSTRHIEHYSIDITQDTIMNNSIDKFVFLKPNETYVDKYNLIGFQITGGTFTFQLDDTRSLDYVETEPVYKDDNKFVIDHRVKKQLPLKVGEYELFTDEFLTSKTVVQFPGVKLKE
jgi:hypothetical protein